MKKIACFCIPAHGHTNPMLPVLRALVDRGNAVRFYSFQTFREKVLATGAEFVACDAYLSELSAKEEARLKRVSTTEMTLQAIKATIQMDAFIAEEFKTFFPDVIFTDSVCFWGKLTAFKYGVPMVVSTSTFAFNQLSSQYMKYSPKELADMELGLPKISKALHSLEPYGYKVKSALSLVQSDNATDSIVYATQRYQPYSESFSEHYLFAGPSLFSAVKPHKSHERPLVYISMGTIINDRPDFYRSCVAALKDMDVDVVLSCGDHMETKLPAPLPERFSAYASVDQPQVLSRANVFITHCGMNSVSESLYMATPMVFYPQTGEQCAVARRASELGAGVFLKNDDAEGIRRAVREVLEHPAYTQAAAECSADFRAAPGPAEAAKFIETAPHTSSGPDVLAELNKHSGIAQIVYWLIVCSIIVLFGLLVTWKNVWIIGVVAGMISSPILKIVQQKRYPKLIQKIKRAER
ncbi:MAG: glycosyl transferase [Clostridia bacterium]|nr:glycosyl transferase [Clostridia bacterium]